MAEVTSGGGSPTTSGSASSMDSALAQAMPEPFVLAVPELAADGEVTDFVIREANDLACSFLRRPRGELLEAPLSSAFDHFSSDRVSSVCREVLRSGTAALIDDCTFSGAAGRPMAVEVRCWQMGGGLALMWRDVTAARARELELARSEEHFRLLAENASDIVIHLRQEHIAWISPSVTRALGWSPAELAGKPFSTLVHAEDRGILPLDADQGPTDHRLRLRLLSSEGGFHWFDSSIGSLHLPDGNQEGWVANFRLVDREVEAEEELQRRAQYDSLTGLVNRAEALARISRESQQSPRTGRKSAVLFCDLDKFKSINDTYGHAAGDEVLRTVARRLTAAVRADDMVARLAGDELLVFLHGVHDLADAVAVAEKLRESAAYPISFDRSYIEATLSIGVALASPREDVDALIARADMAMLRAKEQGRNQVIAIPTHETPRRVLVVDDDGFQLEIAAELLQQAGVEDVLTARDGEAALALVTGDWTTPDLILCDINMPGMDGIELLRHLAGAGYRGGLLLMSGAGSQLLASVSDLAVVHGLNLVGSVTKPLDLERVRASLGALEPGYQSAPVEEVKGVRVGRLTPSEVRDGLDAGYVDIHVQPRVDMGSRKVVALEALLRWTDPERGILSPMAIVPIAEAHDLVEDLTMAVFKRSVDALAELRAAGLDLRMSINVSADNLASLDLPGALVDMTQEAGLQPNQIILEVTESRLMENLGPTLEVIGRLRLRGFGVAIDDYGVGYSNLGKLKQLPVTELKVDRSFVSGAHADSVQRVILESSLALGRSLGLRVVCEGVEDLADWELLNEIACDEAQGFFIARPMPVSELPAWKARWESVWT